MDGKMDLRFKFFAKKNFSWQNSEFLRLTRSHPEVNQNLFETKKITRCEQEKWYWENYSNNSDFLIYIVYDEKVGESVGYIQFSIESLIHRRCEVGYVVHPKYFNKGYGHEFIKWSMFYLINHNDDINRMWLTVFTDNIKAIRLYEKFGFEREGVMRDYVFKNGIYRDVLLMSVLLDKA